MSETMEIPEAAIEAAAKAINDSMESGCRYGETYARAALVAARPYLMPQLHREKVKRALVQALGASKGVLATTHQNHGFDSGCPVCRGKEDEIAEQVVDDLLALLNGAES